MKFAGIGGSTGCDGKQRFATQGQAERRKSGKRSKDTKPYHCAICGYWHNGGVETHRKKDLARKENRRAKLERAEEYDERFDCDEETA